jgi:hypothetical protein
MSNNEMNAPVAPVKHGVFSTAGNVGGGIFGGGIKSMSKTVLWGIGIGALVGATLFMMPAIGAMGSFFGTAAAITGTGALGVVGAVVGGAIGTLGGALVSPLTGLFGATKGGMKAHERVRMETGAANVMQAQVQLMRAQAMNPAVSNDNSNKYNLAEPGSRFNPAGSTVSAMQGEGRLVGQQLARA